MVTSPHPVPPCPALLPFPRARRLKKEVRQLIPALQSLDPCLRNRLEKRQSWEEVKGGEVSEENMVNN
jgi:hypothetical protein